jgi:serine/threonine protein kinase
VEDQYQAYKKGVMSPLLLQNILRHFCFVLCSGPVRALSWHARFRVAAEVATALLFLHSADPPVIHRDLKPANFLLDGQIVSKLANVGLATMLPARAQSLASQMSTLVGTPLYLDPEYAWSRKVSPGSDVYSLGVILLQMLGGLKVDPGQVEEALGKGKIDAVLDKVAGEWPREDAETMRQISVFYIYQAESCELMRHLYQFVLISN